MGDEENLYVPGVNEEEYVMSLAVAARYLRRFGFLTITGEALKHLAGQYPDSFVWNGIPSMNVKSANELIERKTTRWLYAYRDDPPRLYTPIAIAEEGDVNPLFVMAEFTLGNVSVFEDGSTGAYYVETRDDVRDILGVLGVDKSSIKVERIYPPSKPRLVFGPEPEEVLEEEPTISEEAAAKAYVEAFRLISKNRSAFMDGTVDPDRNLLADIGWAYVMTWAMTYVAEHDDKITLAQAIKRFGLC